MITSVKHYFFEIGIWWSCDKDDVTLTLIPPPSFISMIMRKEHDFAKACFSGALQCFGNKADSMVECDFCPFFDQH